MFMVSTTTGTQGWAGERGQELKGDEMMKRAESFRSFHHLDSVCKTCQRLLSLLNVVSIAIHDVTALFSKLVLPHWFDSENAMTW